MSAKVLALSWGNFSGSQSIAFSPDGQRFCCGTNSETGHVFYLTVWDVETGKGAWNSPVKPVLGSGAPKGMVLNRFRLT